MSEFVEAVIHIVDDDESMRTALARLIRHAGYMVRVYASAGEFLVADPGDELFPACLVLDVELSGPGGLELQQALRRRGDTMPIIFISAYQDIPKTVRAIKAGASDFLLKPIDTRKLLAAIESALVASAVSLSTQALMPSIDVALTERERVVLGGVVAGRLNKQIAADLSLSERTIKSCRADLMRKFGARSLAELIRLTEPVLRAAPRSTGQACPEGQSGCLTPR